MALQILLYFKVSLTWFITDGNNHMHALNSMVKVTVTVVQTKNVTVKRKAKGYIASGSHEKVKYDPGRRA